MEYPQPTNKRSIVPLENQQEFEDSIESKEKSIEEEEEVRIIKARIKYLPPEKSRNPAYRFFSPTARSRRTIMSPQHSVKSLSPRQKWLLSPLTIKSQPKLLKSPRMNIETRPLTYSNVRPQKHQFRAPGARESPHLIRRRSSRIRDGVSQT